MSDNGVFSSIFKTIAHEVGSPAGLRELLDSNREVLSIKLDQPNDIAHETLIRWNDWASPELFSWPRLASGDLKGWKYEDGEYSALRIHVKPFKDLVLQKCIEHWKCDIKDVSGLCASKSNLSDFCTLDNFAEERASHLLNDISPQGLRKCLSHNEVRILQPNSGDHFSTYQWDSRLFLMNSGGSHHFAAARYIASKLDMSYELSGKLYIHEITRHALSSLRQIFDVYAIADNNDQFSISLHNFMRSFKVTYFKRKLPKPANFNSAIFLPLDEKKSKIVSSIFRDCGAVNLWEYFDRKMGQAKYK